MAWTWIENGNICFRFKGYSYERYSNWSSWWNSTTRFNNWEWKYSFQNRSKENSQNSRTMLQHCLFKLIM